MSRFVDLTGKTFGRLVATERLPPAKKKTYYLCKCACGNSHTVRSDSLLDGSIHSCGCFRLEQVSRKRGFENTPSLIERFEQRYIPEPNSGCWLWLGGVNPSNGYGRFYTNGNVVVSAHKFSFTFFIGPVPDGLILRHRCDIKTCVNPDHIIPGTYQDNSDDAVERNFVPSGEKHGMSLLTSDEVIAIFRAPGTIAEIARQFNISRMHAQRIKEKKVWRRVLCTL
jgi:hypothetical protein